MKGKRFLVFLLRGLLGGVAGGFILSVFSVFVQIDKFGTDWGQWVFFFFVVVGLPMGLCGGAVTALTIWVVHYFTHANLGPVTRLTIGMFVAIAGLLIYWLMTNERIDPGAFSWNGFFGLVLLGFCLGSLPGLVVGNQQTQSLSGYQRRVRFAACSIIRRIGGISAFRL